MKSVTMSDARAHLPKIVDQVNEGEKEAVEIVRHGKPMAMVVSKALYESLIETIEILSDEKMAGVLIEALRKPKKAKHTLAQVEKDLRL